MAKYDAGLVQVTVRLGINKNILIVAQPDADAVPGSIAELTAWREGADINNPELIKTLKGVFDKLISALPDPMQQSVSLTVKGKKVVSG